MLDPKPMTSVLIRIRRGDTDTQERGSREDGAESGVTWPQPRNTWSYLKLEDTRKDPP